MIESVFHLFKIHRKVVFGNTAIVVQNMFRKAPKSFNAVNVVFRLSIDHGFRMIHAVVLPEAFEGVVAPERVSVVDRTLPRFLPDNRHQLVFAYMLNDSRIHSSIAFQKAKNDAFASRATSPFSLASAAKVCLVKFYLASQLFSFKFRNMIDRLTESVVHSTHCLIVEIKITRETVRRLLFIEASNDRNFFLQLLQRFLFSTGTVTTPNVSSFCSAYFERTAKHTLPSSQKVGRTTENVISSCNHKDILASFGYESN